MKILLDFDFRFVALMILTFADLECCQLMCAIMSGIFFLSGIFVFLNDYRWCLGVTVFWKLDLLDGWSPGKQRC